MLVQMKKLLDEADKEGRAVGSFSVGNMEMVRAAVRASQDTGMPIIIQIAEKRLASSPLALMAPMMVNAAKQAQTPIAVHLDHGLTMDCLHRALDYGFTSVMLDGSLLPYEENVRSAAQAAELAASYGAACEAELGVVGGNEGDSAKHDIRCTDPDTAADFARRTGIDCLAVAIGNAHGNYPVLPELRFDILEKIHRKVDVPLVLHGGTGITDEMFRRAISLGVRKINIATASFDALARAAAEFSAANPKPDYFGLSKAETDAVYNNIVRYIKVFSMK